MMSWVYKSRGAESPLMSPCKHFLLLVLIVCNGGCSASGDQTFSDVMARLDEQAGIADICADSAEATFIASGADDLLNTPLLAVTNKPTTGILPDSRTYVSLATYWWPDPDSDDGLPYIRRDGEVNPETTGQQSDLPRMIEMAQRVELLANAFELTENEKYAKSAIAQLYTWFIDAETSMYPHLEHAQMVRGLNRGRSYGVIDTWWLVRVVESFPHLRQSAYWNDEFEAGLRAWFTHYLNWLRNSEFGRTEMQSENNHGTWYDLQVITFARFVGQEEFARNYLERVSLGRIPDQISISGRQKHEARRPRPLHYSIYNLSGLMKLALHGKELGMDFKNADGWFSGSLEDACRYLVNQMKGTDPALLVHPEDATDTARLYSDLAKNTQELFGSESLPPVQN